MDEPTHRTSIEQPYRETYYFVPSLDTTIKVASGNEILDRFLKSVDAMEWAIVSAFNPGSPQPQDDPLSVLENVRRHNRLYADLCQRKLTVRECINIPMDIGHRNTWIETSFLIVGISQNEATDLAGNQYGQKAIVCGKMGESAILVFTQ